MRKHSKRALKKLRGHPAIWAHRLGLPSERKAIEPLQLVLLRIYQDVAHGIFYHAHISNSSAALVVALLAGGNRAKSRSPATDGYQQPDRSHRMYRSS